MGGGAVPLGGRVAAAIVKTAVCGLHRHGVIRADEHLNGPFRAAEVDLEALSKESVYIKWCLSMTSQETQNPSLERMQQENNLLLLNQYSQTTLDCSLGFQIVTQSFHTKKERKKKYLLWIRYLQFCLCRRFDHNHSLFFQAGNSLDIIVSQISKCDTRG